MLAPYFVACHRLPEIPNAGMYFHLLSHYVDCHCGILVCGDFVVAQPYFAREKSAGTSGTGVNRGNGARNGAGNSAGRNKCVKPHMRANA